ncbi:MAG: hypothetical protein JSV92_05185, partial [archaeon]
NYVLSLIAALLAFGVLRIGKVERELERELLGRKEEVKIEKDGSEGLKIELKLPKEIKLGGKKEEK